MTSTTKRFTTIQECRNCDSRASYHNEEDVRVCTLCGSEWDGVDVRVEVGFCHLHQEVLLDGESCYTCDDHAETARLLMDMDAASAIEEAEEDEQFTECERCGAAFVQPSAWEWCESCEHILSTEAEAAQEEQSMEWLDTHITE